MSRRVLGLLAASAGMVLAVCSNVVAAGVGNPVRAALLVRAALSDASARGSVHVVEAGRTSASTIKFSDDLGISDGGQAISTPAGWRASVLVVGGTAYISGNEAALTSYFGFSASVARKIGAHWVSIPRSDSEYATVADGATLPSAMSVIKPGGPLTEVTTTKVGGTPAIAIRGTGPSVASGVKSSSLTLWVSRSATPLPLRATLADARGDSYTFTFSDWGEHVALKAPAGAIRLATVE